MSLFLTFICLFTCPGVWAAPVKSATHYTIDGASVEFKDFPALKLLISASCLKPDKKFSCHAYQATRSVKLPKDDNVPVSLRNPWTVSCSSAGGKVVIGVDEDGNENSFCKFSDGSLIDIGSLYYYATGNS